MNVEMFYGSLPYFKAKKHKVLAAIMTLLEAAAATSRVLTKGEIVKAIFIADQKHLEEYGRPVTFDNYIAMAKGPVGNCAIDMLNDKLDWREFGLNTQPWRTVDHDGNPGYADPVGEPDRDRLSPSDERALLAALEEVVALGFDATSELPHEHPAWSAAWSGREEGAKVAAMDWRLFPVVSERRVADLVAASWGTS